MLTKSRMVRAVPTSLFILAALVGQIIASPAPAQAVPTQQVEPTSGPFGAVSGPPHSAARRLALQQQYLHSESDASGTPRPDLQQQGIADQQRMAVSSSMPTKPNRFLAPGVTGVQWTQIGPQPLRVDANKNFQGAGPDSGQVVDIAVDPSGSTDKTIYIATNDGGIWKSTDGGTSWKPKSDYMPSLSMGAVVIDPTITSTVYAGTGNNFDGGGTFSKGVGVYKSLDGGDTWTVLNPGGVFTNVAIIRMAMPATGTLLVATASGLFKSVDGGAHFGSNSPTFDDGSQILGGTIDDLHVDTTNSSTVYAVSSGGGLMRSTDSGSTFPTNIFDASIPAHGFVSFSQSTAPDAKTIYANLQVFPGPGGNPAQIWRTVNADQSAPTWTQVTAGSATSQAAGQGNCQCGYDQTIGVDPADKQTIYIGYQKLFASTDGGASFPQVSDNNIHWDEHAITFSPHAGNPRRVYVGNDGGIAASSNKGAAWSNLNEGIATNLFFSVDIGRGSATNRQYSYGGTQDTGIIDHRPGDAGKDWHLGIDGDGGATVVSRQDPTVTYSTDDGCFARTTDSGNNWSTFKAAATALPVCAFNKDGQLNLFAVDPNTQDNLFGATGAKLFRSTNAKTATPPTFTQIDNGFAAGVTAFGTIASNSNILWVGLADGSIRQTTNALASPPTWTTINVTGAPVAAIGGLVVDPTDPATAVVTYEGFNPTGPSAGTPDKRVFRTTTTGASWIDISGTDGTPADILPNLPTHSVVIDPDTTPHGIIVSNDAGVLRSTDNGASWQVLGVGLPTVRGSQLQIDTSASPSLLRLGTYGRSVFELTPASGPLLKVVGNLAFGDVGVGHSASKTVQLFNVGSSDLTVNSITRTSGSSSFTVNGTLPATISAGGHLDVAFTFAATAIGDATAAFNIASNDQFQPNFPLTATATGVKNQTMTVVTSSSNPSVFGEPVTFTATVSDVGGAGTIAPGGTVTFYEGAMVLGTTMLDGANPGHAVLLPAITNFSVGDHLIHAVYAGDGNFLASNSADLTQTVHKAPTTTTVTSSGSPSDFGSPVTFSAHVTFAPPSTNPPVLPTGTVKFSVDGSLIATRTLDQPTGMASFSTSSMLPGTHTIKGDYLGDGNFLASSGTVTQTVTCMHNITGSVPGSLILGPGSTCIVNATVGGAVTVPNGGSGLFIAKSTIGGAVSSTRASIVGICSSSIGGGILIRDATGFVVVGDSGDDGCGANVVLSGAVRLANNHGDVEVVGNNLPSLQVVGTSGVGPFPDDVTSEIESNQVAGAVICSGNVPPPTNGGNPNTVSGARIGQCSSI